MTIIATWAHSRSASTAFLRMMIERGDVLVLHEPLLALQSGGTVRVPVPGGPELLAHTEAEFFEQLERAAAVLPVYLKEVVDYRYPILFDQQQLAGITHTFMVRDPRQSISSHYAMKPTVSCEEIGYERLYELFQLAWAATGRQPLILQAEELLASPQQAVRAFCDYTGLPFLPQALNWQPQDRPEWQRYRDWHRDVIETDGFRATSNVYRDTVDNNPQLKQFYEHHLPFYHRLVEHAS